MGWKDTFYTIDLFAGCGGLSEGFKQAGFEIATMIEMDRWACETLRTRHLFYELRKRRKLSLYHKYIVGKISREQIFNKYPDIRKTIQGRIIQATLEKDSIDWILEKIECSRKYLGASKFHVLLGGPPCQPYSLIGRSRDPDRMENDDRHYLYQHYLEILQRIQPDVFVYENVLGLFSARAGGNRIFSKLLEDFSSLSPSYDITPPLYKVQEEPRSYILDSAAYNIPQRRKRLILIGYRKSLESLNPGLRNIFKRIQKKAQNSDYLTVRDAINDLPVLRPGEGEDDFYGYYNSNKDLTTFQIEMRKHSAGVSNHKARTHMPSDLERYRYFIESCQHNGRASDLEDLIEQRPALAPDHKSLDQFLDRFKVQWWTKPSSTITAHISKDGHYYIHPDINQCRSFTVREAARCQSFPDNFKFEGPRTEQFKQVGNAVPPKLAFVIARVIRQELKKIYEG